MSGLVYTKHSYEARVVKRTDPCNYRVLGVRSSGPVRQTDVVLKTGLIWSRCISLSSGRIFTSDRADLLSSRCYRRFVARAADCVRLLTCPSASLPNSRDGQF